MEVRVSLHSCWFVMVFCLIENEMLENVQFMWQLNKSVCQYNHFKWRTRPVHELNKSVCQYNHFKWRTWPVHEVIIIIIITTTTTTIIIIIITITTTIIFYSLSVNPIENTFSCGCGDRHGYKINYRVYNCLPTIYLL
jgi:hypothetical protein